MKKFSVSVLVILCLALFAQRGECREVYYVKSNIQPVHSVYVNYPACRCHNNYKRIVNYPPARRHSHKLVHKPAYYPYHNEILRIGNLSLLYR